MTSISIPLNLENIEITNTYKDDKDNLIIQLKSTEKGTFCKHCGEYIENYHSLNKVVRLNHLSAFGIPVYIEFQPIRYQCQNCQGKTTTQIPNWYQSKGHCTKQYAQHIVNSLVNNTIKKVAGLENITYNRIYTIIEEHVPTEIDWSKIKNINTLGIDEISLKKIIKNMSLS